MIQKNLIIPVILGMISTYARADYVIPVTNHVGNQEINCANNICYTGVDVNTIWRSTDSSAAYVDYPSPAVAAGRKSYLKLYDNRLITIDSGGYFLSTDNGLSWNKKIASQFNFGADLGYTECTRDGVHCFAHGHYSATLIYSNDGFDSVSSSIDSGMSRNGRGGCGDDWCIIPPSESNKDSGCRGAKILFDSDGKPVVTTLQFQTGCQQWGSCYSRYYDALLMRAQNETQNKISVINPTNFSENKKINMPDIGINTNWSVNTCISEQSMIFSADTLKDNKKIIARTDDGGQTWQVAQINSEKCITSTTVLPLVACFANGCYIVCQSGSGNNFEYTVLTDQTVHFDTRLPYNLWSDGTNEFYEGL